MVSTQVYLTSNDIQIKNTEQRRTLKLVLLLVLALFDLLSFMNTLGFSKSLWSFGYCYDGDTESSRCSMETE